MVASKHVLEQPKPPSKLNSDISPGLEAVIMKALSKNPDNRYQDAEEMRADLERARLGQPVEATPLLSDSARTQRIAPTGPPTAVLPPVQAGGGGGRRWWIPALIVLLILAVLGGGLYLLASSLLSTNAASVKVPDVRGFTEEAATRTLKEQDFKVDTVTQVSANPGDWQHVLTQTPAPGALVDKGSTVKITVGKPPKQVAVPNVVGLTEDQAKTAITDAGLKVGTVTPQTDPAPPGEVIGQDPSANTTANKGSTVDLVVSSGPSQVTVPDLTCLSYGKARSVLAGQDLQIQNAGEMPPSLACSKFGKVVAQDPSAGSQADSGSTVSVWLVGLSSPSPSPTPTPSSGAE
jgi:beta-lactam-binding protein with PASTA domain